MKSVEIEKFPPMQNWIMMLFDRRSVSMTQKKKLSLLRNGSDRGIEGRLFCIQIGKMLHIAVAIVSVFVCIWVRPGSM